MAWARDFLDWYEKVLGVGLPIQMPLILIAGILILFGAVKMLKFKSIGWARTAAILAMIPLTRSVLWGPMAVAIMAGLIIATVLTILAVPAIYAAWYRVKRPAI